MSNEVVPIERAVWPIGKYKGQSVERAMADRGYIGWTLAQPWFAERYTEIHRLVVNHGAEPQDSPEHNEFQMRFLDEAVQLAVVKAASIKVHPRSTPALSFEESGWDVSLKLTHAPAGYAWLDGKVLIELKPDLGDDYPSVMRQMKRYPGCGSLGNPTLLIARRAEFSTVSLDQVKTFFTSSGITLLLESELDAYL